MRHLSIESLINYIDGRVSEDDKPAMDQHLSACRECTEITQRMESLVLQLQQDARFEPSPGLVQWAINLFQPLVQPSSGGKLRKIIASLIFDTYDQPMLA